MTTPSKSSSANKKRHETLSYRCWRIFFAIIGLLDCSCYCYCYYHFRYDDANCSAQESHQQQAHSCGTNSREDATAPIFFPLRILGPSLWESMAYSHHPIRTKEFTKSNYYESLFDDPITWMLCIHVAFGILCIFEMVLRAAEARRIVFEHQAIAAFEERIADAVAKVYRRRKSLGGKAFSGTTSFYSLLKAAERPSVSAMTTTRTVKRNPYLPSLSSSLSNMTGTTASSDSASSEDIHRCHHIIEEEEEDEHETSETMKDEADDDERNIRMFLRATIHLWIPVGVTCFCWISILPLHDCYRIITVLWKHVGETDILTGWDYLDILGGDKSWATIWIIASITQWNETSEFLQDYLRTALWKQYILAEGKRIKQRPKLVWQRVGRFLNLIKLVRFAGPFARMILKLNDQLLVGYSTFRKVRSAKTHKAHVIQRPSNLMRELRLIESFHKIEMTIASWPSECSMLLDTLTKEVRSPFSGGATGGIVKVSSSAAQFYAQEFLETSRERGRQITREIQRIQGQIRRGLTEFSSSEVYDNIRKLSKDISHRHLNSSMSHESDDGDKASENIETKSSVDTAPKSPRRHHSSNRSSNWYDYLHIEKLLNSRDYLISPRSRFSVMWRITVTNCLLMELTRLAISWYSTRTFHLSITQVISRLFVDCSNIPEETKRHFRFFTDRVSEWHAALSHAVPLIPFPKDTLFILCVPTSQSSKLFLLAGSLMEIFIDVVSFMDIFFWFFTGDLDAETGLVVPKAFFGRCILPGTLVQILDHPTLPTVLPSLMNKVGSMAMELGWSRVIRWLSALIPALTMVVFRPLSAYFFRHFEEKDSHALGKEDLLMKYAESFGYLPQRHSMSLGASAAQMLQDDERSSDDDSIDDDGDGDNINQPSPTASASTPMSRRSSLQNLTVNTLISTPPGSPKRSSLRTPSSTSPWRFPSPDSTVHFAADRSVTHRHSSMYDIGLSLSSHDLQQPNFTEKGDDDDE